MRKKAPKSLGSVHTRRTQAEDARSPHRRYLRIATLELRKQLCTRVRAASHRRIAELDAQLSEIAEEESRLLEALQQAPAAGQPLVPEPHFSGNKDTVAARCGFTVKY